MRILAVERDTTACNYYRILQPVYKLSENGMAHVMTIKEGAELGTEWAFQKMTEADIIVVHRPASEEWFKFIKICQKAGKIIVCDYDDDPFNTHPLNPYYQFIGTQEVEYAWSDGTRERLWSKDPAEHGGRYLNIEQNIRRRDLFRASFRKADLVTTTTDILAEKLKLINQNVAVLPNLIDFDFFPQVECVKKEIRVGWQGGSSHYEDLWMVSKAMKDIMKKYSNVNFVFMGDMLMYGLFRDVPVERVECQNWVRHNVYPYKLATLNLDIGLCPVIANEFNRNKSALKWMEYSVMKTATIASDWPPYSNVIDHGETGLLVKQDDDHAVTTQRWFDAIEQLVLDVEKRRKMGEKAFDKVHAEHNANDKAYLWFNAYEKLLKKDLTNELQLPRPTEQTV